MTETSDPCLTCQLKTCDDKHPGCAFTFPETYQEFINVKRSSGKSRSIIKVSLGRTRAERKARFRQLLAAEEMRK